ncbi:MAG TPA: hypothetical protein VJP79_10175 [Nitrososphaera sp.]|nr:hypothetical protein [Nitrososphaera sp.]
MPVFELQGLIDSLEGKGYSSRVGSVELDVHPVKRPYFERWLLNRDGFVRMQSGNVDYVGIEEVVRMGPFFNVYCIVENDFIVEADENAHKLLDAGPYYELLGGKATRLGWSGGVVATILAKDEKLSEDFSKSIMNEEVKRITLKASNYCCVIETRTWDPAGIASSFDIIDRIAFDVRKLIKSIHLGEDVGI